MILIGARGEVLGKEFVVRARGHEETRYKNKERLGMEGLTKI